MVSGESIQLPAWFCRAQGHSLYNRWVAGIEWLKSFGKEEKLRLAVLTRVVADVPQLLSDDVRATLASLVESEVDSGYGG